MDAHGNRRLETDPTRTTTASSVVVLIAAASVLVIGFDFFLHAGLLSRLYLEPSPFLLGPEEAFRRIPFGYLAFLILTVSLWWVLRRLDVRGARDGFRFGTIAGAAIWGAFSIGLYSISTAAPSLLAGWWLGQALELGLVGAVLGAAAGGVSRRRIWAIVTIVAVACIVVTVVLQSLGWAPAARVSDRQVLGGEWVASPAAGWQWIEPQAGGPMPIASVIQARHERGRA